MEWTEEMIERVAELASDPKNLRPLTPEEWEWVRETSAAIEASYTDDHWRRILNAMVPARAVDELVDRSPEDRQRLLEMMAPDHRAEVERLLAVTV